MSAWTLEQASTEEWIRAWEVEPSRTRFQHPCWHRVFCETWPERFALAPYRLRGADGTDAILPGCTRRLLKGFASEWTSSPGHTYGGLLGSHSPEASREAQRLLLKHHASYLWIGNPFTNAYSVMQPFTQSVDLNQSAADLDRTINHARNLAHARRAERDGLRLQRWDGDATAFASIYDDAQDRWNSTTGARNGYPIDFLNRVFRMEGAEIWAVCSDSEPKPLAMGIFLVSGTHVVSWLPLARQSALPLRPYQFMNVSLIRHYHQRGFLHFDFNPSAGLEGVIEFKQRFGAVRKHYPEFRGQRAWIRAMSMIRTR